MEGLSAGDATHKAARPHGGLGLVNYVGVLDRRPKEQAQIKVRPEGSATW